ncbi:GAF domain-containing protein, partial [Candidatus Binatia bacterium]|nr:GAF domain-containing protein [Candidatus Binatia bacterium]
GLPPEEVARRVLDVAVRGLAGSAGVVLRHAAEEHQLVAEAEVGWRRAVGTLQVAPGEQARLSLLAGAALRCDDLGAEPHVAIAPLLAEHDLRSCVSVALHADDTPQRMIVVAAADASAFDAEDASFLETIAELLAEAIARQRAGEEIARRIVEQRAAHAAAGQADHRVRRLFEDSLDAMVEFEDDGRFVEVNAAACELFGLSRDELLARSAREVATPDGGTVALRLASSLAGARTGEVEIGRPSGEIRVLEYSVTRVAAHRHAASLRDVTPRKRAERRTDVLLGIAQDVAGALGPRDVLQRVAKRLGDGLSCDALVAWYWDPDGELYRVSAHVGVPPELVAEVEALVFAPDEPFAAALAQGAIAIDGDASQSAIPRSTRRHFAIGAMLAAPLRNRERLVGAITAYHRTPGRSFGCDATELLDAAATTVSVALEAAELYDAQRKTGELSAQLARFSRDLIESFHNENFLERLCRTAAEMLDADASCFIARRDDQDDFVALASHGGIGGDGIVAGGVEIPARGLAAVLAAFERDDVAQTESGAPPFDQPSLHHPLGLATQLAIALRKGPHLAGMLVVARSGHGTPFGLRDKIFARSIAHVASLALQHARVVAELRRSNELKTELFGLFSHEVRTPLNIVIGYQDLLLDGACGDLTAPQQDVLRRSLASARALCQLVDNSLDFSRLDRGTVPLEQEDTSIAMVLGALDAETYLMRETSGVPLTLILSPDLGWLRTDSGKLRAALRNLLVNAFQFTNQGTVTVSAAPRDGGVEISVADTGSGMRAEVVARLFRPFPREGDTSWDEAGRTGVGLGLFVAGRLVSLLGGHISVESEPGRGSTFRVWIPDLRGIPERDREALAQLTTARRCALVPLREATV